MISLGLKKNTLLDQAKIIGVTGTHGKTIVTELIAHLLRKNEYVVASLSTQGFTLPNQPIQTEFRANSLTKAQYKDLLREVEASGAAFFVVEMTSKLLQKKVYQSTVLDAGAITNVKGDTTHWKSWEEYADTKVSFLKMIRPNGLAVINGQDVDAVKWFETRSDELKNDLFCYWVDQRNLSEVHTSLKGLAFNYYDGNYWESPLLGEHNVANVYLATKVCARYLDDWQIQKALPSFSPPKGRFELAHTKPFNIIIDAAKTPEQIEQTLYYLAKHKSTDAQIISVFGSHGNKWQDNRKAGEIVTHYSDMVILAPTDPNNENAADINAVIQEYAAKAGGRTIERVFSNDETNLLDRSKLMKKVRHSNSGNETPLISFDAHDYTGRLDAISFSLTIPKNSEDIVYITGKGDEDFLLFDNTEYEWSDHEAVQIALKNLRLQ